MFSASFDDISRVIEQIYASAGDANAWHTLLKRLCELFYAESAAVTVQAHDGISGQRWSIGYKHDAENYFGRNAAQNLLLQGMALRSRGKAYVSAELIENYQLQRTPYYSDWLKPNAIESCLGMIYDRHHNNAHWITLNRPAGRAQFEAEEARLLTMLAPHFARANKLYEQLSAARQARIAAEAALNALYRPIILLNDIGRVKFANDAVNKLLEQHDGLYLSQARLRGVSSTVTACIDAAIGTVQSEHAFLQCSPAVVALPRLSGSPLLASFFSLPITVVDKIIDEARILVIITDPDQIYAPSGHCLQTLFRMTRAEIRVASKLAAGYDLATSAEHLGISKQTARTHLKAIFRKTRTDRQSDLIRILSNVAR